MVSKYFLTSNQASDLAILCSDTLSIEQWMVSNAILWLSKAYCNLQGSICTSTIFEKSKWMINQRIVVNPLTPKRDQLLISPNGISPESNIKVMGLTL